MDVKTDVNQSNQNNNLSENQLKNRQNICGEIGKFITDIIKIPKFMATSNSPGYITLPDSNHTGPRTLIEFSEGGADIFLDQFYSKDHEEYKYAINGWGGFLLFAGSRKVFIIFDEEEKKEYLNVVHRKIKDVRGKLKANNLAPSKIIFPDNYDLREVHLHFGNNDMAMEAQIFLKGICDRCQIIVDLAFKKGRVVKIKGLSCDLLPKKIKAEQGGNPVIKNTRGPRYKDRQEMLDLLNVNGFKTSGNSVQDSKRYIYLLLENEETADRATAFLIQQGYNVKHTKGKKTVKVSGVKDLSGSKNVKTKNKSILTASNFNGNLSDEASFLVKHLLRVVGLEQRQNLLDIFKDKLGKEFIIVPMSEKISVNVGEGSELNILPSSLPQIKVEELKKFFEKIFGEESEEADEF